MVFGINDNIYKYPLVTVIVGTKDRPVLILRAIESILNQTYSNLECLIIDCSIENDTQKLISKIQDDRVKYFRLNPDPGRIASLNFGILKAEGDMICFLDDDDEYFAEKIGLQVDALNNCEENVGMAFCWALFFDESMNQSAFYLKNNINGNAFCEALESMAFCSFPALMIKKRALLDVMFTDDCGYPSDWLFVARFTKKYHVITVQKVLVKANINHMYDRMSQPKLKDKEYYRKIKNFHIHFFKLFEDDYRLIPLTARIHLFAIISASAQIKNLSDWLIYSAKAIKLNYFDLATYITILRSIGTVIKFNK